MTDFRSIGDVALSVVRQAIQQCGPRSGDIVERLRDHGGVRTLREIAAELEVPAEDVAPVLVALEAVGFVYRRDMQLDDWSGSVWWAPRFDPDLTAKRECQT